MKPIRPLLFAALALGAPLAPLHAQAAAADTAPANWHLLDATADHFPGISAERAYRELLAGRQPRDTVVVAIIDSGVEVDHPDLAGIVWTNPRERAGNGRDDDGNGGSAENARYGQVRDRDPAVLFAHTELVRRIAAALLSFGDAPA